MRQINSPPHAQTRMGGADAIYDPLLTLLTKLRPVAGRNTGLRPRRPRKICRGVCFVAISFAAPVGFRVMTATCTAFSEGFITKNTLHPPP